MATVPTKVQLTIKGKDETGKAFRSVSQKAQNTGSKLMAAFKVAAIVAAIAKIGQAVKAALDDMNKLHDIAQQAGTSAVFLQKFVGAMGQAGIVTNTEGLVASMQKLNKAITDPEKLIAFDKLGFDIRQFEGMSPEKTFIEFMIAVSRCNDESRRLLLLQRGMEEQGLKLAPLMRLGPDALRKSLDDVMAMIPATSENTVNLATNANNAFALVAADFKTRWYEMLGSLLTWADETFHGVDKAIMRTWQTMVLVLKNTWAMITAPLWGIAEAVAMLWVNLLDGLKLILFKIIQMFEAVERLAVRLSAAVAGIFSDELAGRLHNYASEIGEESQYYIDQLFKRNNITQKPTLFESFKNNAAEFDAAMKRWNKGLDAKATLTSMTPGTPTMAKLTSNVAGAVGAGVKKGLARGIESSSYDAIKAAFTAASKQGMAAAAADAVNVTAPAAARAATVASAAGNAGNIERLLSDLLSVVRGGVGSLQKLEAF